MPAPGLSACRYIAGMASAPHLLSRCRITHEESPEREISLRQLGRLRVDDAETFDRSLWMNNKEG